MKVKTMAVIMHNNRFESEALPDLCEICFNDIAIIFVVGKNICLKKSCFHEAIRLARSY